jgi:hypothetical protein
VVLVGREGVGGFVELATFEPKRVEVALAVGGTGGILETFFATGIPDVTVLFASFKNLFGFPSSHWFT